MEEIVVEHQQGGMGESYLLVPQCLFQENDQNPEKFLVYLARKVLTIRPDKNSESGHVVN